MQAGSTIDGKVRLIRRIGSGGMGSVWVAHHRALDTEVAVKLIARDGNDERSLARFRREASLAAKIKSPHVVQIFDYGISGDTPYIVMELLEGESLAERIEAGPLPLSEVCQIVSQVAVALEAAHALDIVHRDIKPANIFLCNSGYRLFAKLLDFGVAKQQRLGVEHVTATGAIVGTPHYMSPEQLLSTRDVDRHADLWALAVVAYQAMTATLPFDGKTLAAVTVAIRRGRFVPVSALVDDASPELDAWFKLALFRSVKGRYGSARELAEAFVAAAAGGEASLPLEPRSQRRPASEPRAAEPDDAGEGDDISGHDTEAAPRRAAALPSGSLTMTSERSPIAQAEQEDEDPAQDDATIDVRAGAAARPRSWPRWAVAIATLALALLGVRHWSATPTTSAERLRALTPVLPPPHVPDVPPTEPPAPPQPHEPVEQPEPGPPAPREPREQADAPPAPAVPPAPATETPGPDCSTPFTIDAKGIYRARPECLQANE